MNKEEQFIVNVKDLFDKMSWLNKFRMESYLKDYKPSEVHCIEYIEKNRDANVTKLAKALYMTRGAISKLTKKLLNKGLIDTYQKPDNKKEVYFKLTEEGKDIFNTHEAIHKEFRERDRAVLSQITDEQYDSMLNFIEMYSHHLDEEIKKQGLTIN